MTAVITGTFDPITVGHEDIINRASKLFDKVVVVVTDNTEKKNLLTDGIRFESVKAVFEDNTKVEVTRLKGLVSEFVKSIGGVIVRGVRGTIDFDYEKMLSDINRELEGVDTVLIPARKEYAFISSTFVRDLIIYGRPIDKYVPEKALKFIKNEAD
ncbi:MAG: pantetheine-phosphate adenylyltransferase [Clostridiales bacterium]|jgi:pantetheine-phosphate adenylyltransferase|nr:pantetheine-phosphate adenylyltransferase [Clostridiales bacterium]